ncbi:hypothetical protein GKQ23_07145 [Erwinia sp. E602]|uniref:aromatic-ring-hydroxylating dioxygenase subunit beta n=1 Tax=unclassified Erwinia TaxID=2622719 RepID=UPI000C75773C|nr:MULTISPECIES: aromatic-ring-hydroxylating dioxygenase subunit beta [unclassified Erwinia]PLV63233.1 aromatic-ring-hydroxylating dioxygenase [Erwinia sp. B116]QUG74785.1 hypothetical protein GKQ23_07145 [Erwinia sp. E602]
MSERQQVLSAAIGFINDEADLLDRGAFHHWLALWHPEGLYVVPIDPATEDFANTLNYALDDQQMREKRVKRLCSGEAISATPQARTIRISGRHHLLSASERRVDLRCAQSLWVQRKGLTHHTVADVSYQLVPQGDSFLIQQKVVRLINAEDYLLAIGYIL